MYVISKTRQCTLLLASRFRGYVQSPCQSTFVEVLKSKACQTFEKLFKIWIVLLITSTNKRYINSQMLGLGG